jgi:hypothetical protein
LHSRDRITHLSCESLRELSKISFDVLDALYILSNFMPAEKYLRNGYIIETDYTDIIKEMASKLSGLNSLKLSLGLEYLERLKELLAKGSENTENIRRHTVH